MAPVVLAPVALACKAAVAVLLVAAGGAKLADLPGFAASVRLFRPGPAAPRADRAVAAGIAAGEITAGAASLSSPRASWLNLVVLAICCGFVAVSAAGYRWHRGRSCRCFGALSRRRFNLAGLGRSVLIALGAAAATAPVRAAAIQLGPADRVGLLAGALLVAGAAFSAAAAVGAGRGAQDAQPGWALMIVIPEYLAVAQWALLGALGVLVVIMFRQLGRLLTGARQGSRTRPAGRRPGRPR